MKLTFEEKFFARVQKGSVNGCWLWKGYLNPGGYGMVLCRGRMALAHRVSWTLHRGEIPEGMLICHICDVRACVNPEHLFLGTPGTNAADARRKGRLFRPRFGAKLTPDQVQQIRLLLDRDKMYMTEIARQFGVSSTTIRAIKFGQIWTHIPWPEEKALPASASDQSTQAQPESGSGTV